MKRFLVEHKSWDKPPIRVILYEAPYEDENILNKTGWKIKDVTITEVFSGFEIDAQKDDSIIDSEIDLGEE